MVALEVGVDYLGDPWGWYDLDVDQRADLLALRRIRQARAKR